MLSEMKASSLKQRQKIATFSDISTTLDILTTSKLFHQTNKKYYFYETFV